MMDPKTLAVGNQKLGRDLAKLIKAADSKTTKFRERVLMN